MLTQENLNKMAAYTRKWKANIRRQVIAKLGGKCVSCGFTDWRAFHIDHIKHIGAKNRENWLVQSKRILSGDTTNYQLLCSNCNAIKKHENREVPHITHFELEVT